MQEIESRHRAGSSATPAVTANQKSGVGVDIGTLT